ncbi:MAG: ABC transporter permease [Acidobacteria bacterium]|nr:ABC transporter permease [Acidobacteriota bacterium]
METLRQDLRYAFRMLVRNRTITLFAIVALALGIGANSAIFSVYNAVLLRPLPYEDPDRLVMVYGVLTRDGQQERRSASYPDFLDWRSRNRAFDGISVINSTAFNLTGLDTPERVRGELVSADHFTVLGVQPFLGRTFFGEEDQTLDTHRVAVISHGFWRRRFAADQNAIGKQMDLNGRAFTVIGVMPESFRGVGDNQSEVWMPMAMVSTIRPAQILGQRQQRWLSAVARLKPGVTLAQAQDEMNSISKELENLYPDTNGLRGAEVASVHDEIFGQYRLALVVLLAAVGFVLLIACGNVANLLLARSAARQKEVAIRTALGAGRTRVIRQLLTESIVLSVMSGLLGLLIAMWGTGVLLAQNLISFPSFVNVGIDARVLGFSVGVSLLTGLLFGIFPALQIAQPAIAPALKEGGRGFPGGVKRTRLLNALVISEVTLAVVLLVGATLMIRSVREIQEVDPGFDAGNVLTMRISLPTTNYTGQQALQVASRILERAAALPGVDVAGIGSDLPLIGGTSSGAVEIEGRPEPAPGAENIYYRHRVTPGYFDVFRIPILRGRSFTWNDNATAPRVIVVSESFAKQHWPGEDPIGKRVTADGASEGKLTVIGVAADVKFRGFPENPVNGRHPDIYYSLAQFPNLTLMLAVRTKVESASMTATLRQAIQEVDPNLPAYSVVTMHELIANQIANTNFTTLLLSTFSALALLLAVIGVYAVISYSVDQRTHEIGVRMALGAQQRDILRLLLGHGMGLVLAGLALGITVATIMTRLISDLLYGVSATDPATFLAVSFLMIAISVFASVVPARRASRVDPMTAVRYE